jgi:tetratricopeptide (TPR) repeat protein
VLVRDVAYGQIPRAERAGKHVRAAEWIESLGRPQDHSELIAHHYVSALELAPSDEFAARARKALGEAGDRALALNAFANAAEFYRDALELTPEDDPARAQLLLGLGRAEFDARSAGAEILEEAAAGLVAARDVESAAEAETMLAVLAWEAGDDAGRWAHLDRAVELVADAPPSRANVTALAVRARHLYLAGHYSEGLEAARDVLAMAESAGLGELRANALNTIGMARRDLLDSDGYEELRESIAIAESINSIEAFKGYNNLAVFLQMDGRLQEQAEVELAALRVAERFGAAGHVRWTRAGQCWLPYALGDWDEALRRADDFIAELAGSSHYMESGTRALRVLIGLARDDTEGGRAQLSKILEQARAAKDPQALYPSLGLSAYFAAETGDLETATALFRELLAAQRAASGRWSFGGPPNVVWAAARVGVDRELLANFTHARSTPWFEAAEAIVAGDWVAAAAVYERIGASTHEAFSRLRAGEQLAAEGRHAEADIQLGRALEFYRSVRATRYLQQGEALLAASA